jgi:hypothetical protein
VAGAQVKTETAVEPAARVESEAGRTDRSYGPVGSVGLLHLGDRGRRTAMGLSLQRRVGNARLGRTLAPGAPVLQRCTHGCGCMELDESEREVGAAPAVPAAPPVQRRASVGAVVQRDDENLEKLRQVQGQAMFALLPTLAGMDRNVLADEEAARTAGGPRLIVAIHAVQQKGDWKAYATANAGELAALPTDQIGDVMRYVGAPKNVGLYERGDFGGRFDAFVDPVTKSITLIFKAKAIPVEDNPPTAEEMATFKAGFKSSVEVTWSGKGTVQPACPVPGVGAFTTRVVVHFVEGGEHLPIIVYSSRVRIGVIETDIKTGARTGRMSADAGETQKREQYPGQGKSFGKLPPGQPLTSEQATAAHEFGHAIGVDHVHCKGDATVCYGTNQQEWDDVMGGGMKLQRMKVGGELHSDFSAFEKIGERWGKDVFPGPLAAKCNKWGA